MPLLSPLLSAGAMFSFFALASSCMNAGARVMFAMGRHPFFHKSTSAVHADHGTPHVALAVMAVTMFIVVTACRYLFKLQVLDEFNDAGTMGAFGFLGSYVLVTIAAPMFVKQIGERKPEGHCVLRGGPGSDVDPGHRQRLSRPDPPVRYFPYIFLAYLAVGLTRVGLDPHERSRSSPGDPQGDPGAAHVTVARGTVSSDPSFGSAGGRVGTCPCRFRSRGIASLRRSGRTGCRAASPAHLCPRR